MRFSAPTRNELRMSSRLREEEMVKKDASGGDRTAIELFIAGIQGWEAGLRQIISGKSSSDTQS